MATNQPFTNLDFQEIKTNLKDYLKSQDKFKDYNFEGSNMNVLLDILSYNTFQNNFYTNMAISEMFLDSAQLEDSVVSHAKMLNYTPRSRRSARMTIDLTFYPTDVPPSITLPARTAFTAICGTEIYYFYNREAHVITPLDGVYKISGLEIYEGKYVTEYYNVKADGTDLFILNNDNVDTTSIEVFIQENSTADSVEYLFTPSVYGVGAEDKVFFVQGYKKDRYEIRFGQNVYGKEPVNGNILAIRYMTTNGDEANGISVARLDTPVDGYQSGVAVTAPSQGGADRENLAAIKEFAPKSLQVQERAVTENDYVVLLKNRFPQIRAASVYGGEKLIPPQYGRVVVAAYVSDDENIPESTKQLFIDYLKDKIPFTLETIVVPAKFMYLEIVSNVYFDPNVTNKSAGAIRVLVNDKITEYGSNNLDDFKRNFRYSALTSAIDSADTSILSNDTTVRGVITIAPIRTADSFYVLQFSNPLKPDVTFSETQIDLYEPCVISDTFTFANRTVYFMDNGQGRLDVVSSVDNKLSYVTKGAGSVDYTTGDVTINTISIQDYDGDGINFYARMSTKDILAPSDRIIRIRPEDITLNVQQRRR